MIDIQGKVILSRKGFDTSSGGDYSRVDPETRKYVVIPIPEYNNLKKENTREDEKEDEKRFFKYEQIRIKTGYIPVESESNLKSLIKEIPMNNSARRYAEKYAHFDPWLGKCPWLPDDANHKIGALGQQGFALRHLEKQGVARGSLFLFYSRFKPLQGRHNNLFVHPGRSYFIYGWLKVDKILPRDLNSVDERIKNELESKKHPHFYKLNDKNNWIYLGSDTGYLEQKNTIKGFGYFPVLHDKLRLSKEGDDPNVWELPEFFDRPGNERPTYLKDKKWSKQNANKGKTVMDKLWGRGQEFVFDITKVKPEFDDWLKDLFSLLRNNPLTSLVT